MQAGPVTDREHGIALVPHGADELPYRLRADIDEGADGRWQIAYRLDGKTDDIVVPNGQGGCRRDGLWRHSCFELFAMRPDGTYVEWNFAPDGDWAVYEFSAYRAPVTPPPATTMPVIEWRARQAVCRVAVDVWPLTGSVDLSVGISAVIERADGSRDFWAIAHGDGPPDFHGSTCFALRVSPPVSP